MPTIKPDTNLKMQQVAAMLAQLSNSFSTYNPVQNQYAKFLLGNAQSGIMQAELDKQKEEEKKAAKAARNSKIANTFMPGGFGKGVAANVNKSQGLISKEEANNQIADAVMQSHDPLNLSSKLGSSEGLGNAVGGAASGFMSGGPYGAVMGGIMGLLGGGQQQQPVVVQQQSAQPAPAYQPNLPKTWSQNQNGEIGIDNTIPQAGSPNTGNTNQQLKLRRGLYNTPAGQPDHYYNW